MKRKIVKSCGLIMMTFLVTLGMTGCGNQIPELTDEQAEKIGEYAVITLLKYDAEQRSRLVDAETIEAYDKKQQELKELEASQTPEPTPEGMRPVEDTPVKELEQTTAVTQTNMSVSDSLAVPEGTTVAYLGYKTCDTYPNDGSTNDYFSLDASEGKKLLVLEFVVENSTAADVSVDFFSTTNVYSVDAGNGTKCSAMTTMLLDDMSTYAGTIPAGGKQNLVLLFEIEQGIADSMAAPQLYFRNESGTYTIPL